MIVRFTCGTAVLSLKQCITSLTACTRSNFFSLYFERIPWSHGSSFYGGAAVLSPTGASPPAPGQTSYPCMSKGCPMRVCFTCGTAVHSLTDRGITSRSTFTRSNFFSLYFEGIVPWWFVLLVALQFSHRQGYRLPLRLHQVKLLCPVFQRDSPMIVRFDCGTAALSPTGVSPPSPPALDQTSFHCISMG